MRNDDTKNRKMVSDVNIGRTIYALKKKNYETTQKNSAIKAR